MARRIREFNWADHPFGIPENWPQSLRSALSVCLHSSFPTAIYWGPELRLLYNDAWAPIPGPRHPKALGAPAKEVWSDIWHVIEPQFLHLIETGEGIFVEDQMLPMRRFGITEETYWSYSFTAIRGEDGAIAGVFNSGNETTRNVLSQRQMRFLLELGEVFRRQTDLDHVRRSAIEMLGQHLGVDRVELSERGSRNGDELEGTEHWTALESGAIRASATQANIDEVAKDRDANGVATSVVVPWIENGKLLASVSLYSRKLRQWNEWEINTAEKVLERIVISAERLRVAEREKIMAREIDHRARNALAVVQSVIRQTPAEDVKAFRKKIEDRIAALARSYALLSEENWGPVDFRTLLSQELAPYVDKESATVRTEGPPVRLGPQHAQLLALLMHELITNAAKHGALKEPGGSLDVFWSMREGNLHVDWIERSSWSSEPGPDGFGSTLISRVVQNQFGGAFSRSFDQDGLRCEIAIPLA